jgi:hypothetical protein
MSLLLIFINKSGIQAKHKTYPKQPESNSDMTTCFSTDIFAAIFEYVKEGDRRIANERRKDEKRERGVR